jgi:hypothetical protein
MAFDFGKLVKYLKANPEASQREAAEDQGLTIGQVSMTNFCKAKVDAGVVNKAPGTAASIKKLRDNEGDRWELIAARTSKSVSQVQALYEEAGGDLSNSYTGKGRNFQATPAGKKPAGKKGAAATKPTGTRGRPKGSTNKAKATIVRNKSRRGAGNPS